MERFSHGAAARPLGGPRRLRARAAHRRLQLSSLEFARARLRRAARRDGFRGRLLAAYLEAVIARNRGSVTRQSRGTRKLTVRPVRRDSDTRRMNSVAPR